MNSDFNDGNGASFIARLQPNGHTLPHTHSGEEVITALKGEVEVSINGKVEILRKGQSMKIIAGHVRTVRNRTSELVYVQAAFFPGFAQQETVIVEGDS